MTSLTEASTARASFDGIELEYSARGSGEPVVLIHGAIFADGLSLLRTDSKLTNDHRVVSYSRRGFGGSTHQSEQLSISEQASDCRKLMDHLRIRRAHVVGHSLGGAIALQLAHDAPEYVHSLSLLEPMMPSAIITSSPMAQRRLQLIMQVVEIYQRGDKAGAIDAFCKRMVGLDNYRIAVEEAKPGAFEQAVADADTFFKVELSSLQNWSFTNEDANRLKQPVLYVGGAQSVFAPFAKELGEVITRWFPKSETIWLPNATHSFTLTNKEGLTETLAGFFARHPISD